MLGHVVEDPLGRLREVVVDDDVVRAHADSLLAARAGRPAGAGDRAALAARRGR